MDLITSSSRVVCICVQQAYVVCSTIAIATNNIKTVMKMIVIDFFIFWFFFNTFKRFFFFNGELLKNYSCWKRRKKEKERKRKFYLDANKQSLINLCILKSWQCHLSGRMIMCTKDCLPCLFYFLSHIFCLTDFNMLISKVSSQTHLLKERMIFT